MRENTEERKRLSQRIAGLRKAKSLSQKALAERAGLSQAHVARIESGKYSVSFDILTSVANALGVRVELI